MNKEISLVLLMLIASLFAGCFESDGDGDGIMDSDDNCPDIDNPIQGDHDLTEGIDGGNECDDDDDNDGLIDTDDDCPIGDVGWISSNLTDIDSDGCRDSTEDYDDDNDGVLDNDDNCPIIPNSGQEDHDLDNEGNICDSDDDNDGVADSSDDCPLGTTDWSQSITSDYDMDGCETSEDFDDDNDGVLDADDDFPLDGSEYSDLDNDGIGDNSDEDDDGDGWSDSIDEFPLDSSEQSDSDNDGIGDNADTDDDNDGCTDDIDEFPFDVTECSDYDGDGIGDNADSDDDNDGIPDVSDACPLSYDILGYEDVFELMVYYGISLTEVLESGDTNGDGQIDDYDGDGCLVWEDYDDDNDGLHEGAPGGEGEWWLYSARDNCVIVPTLFQGDLDGDGKGDVCDDDIDGDGVNNDLDWDDTGNGMITFSFLNFSVWSGGNYDSGGGLPDVYPYIGVGSWDGTQCNDINYNENYLNYVEEDAYQLDNWISIYWDVPDDISIMCFSLTMYDEDAWAVDGILDFVPGSNDAIQQIWQLTNDFYELYEYDNRGENSQSILLEFEIFAWTAPNQQ